MNITISDFYRNISLTQCLNLIVQNNNIQNGLISVYSQFNGFEFAYKQMDYSKKVFSEFNPTKPQMYLFENLEEDKLSNFLKGLRHRNITFNARAKYILVGKEFDEKFLRMTVKYFLFSALFLNSYSGEIRTYFPFKANSHNIVDTKLVPIGTCADGKLQMVNNYTNLFPKKLPTTWKNWTIPVMYLHHQVYSMCGKCEEQGIEIEIFDTISKIVGVNASFYRVDSPQMAQRLYHEGVFNIFLTNYMPLLYTEFTMSFIREVYFWFAPFEGITPRWSNILTVFSLEVWLSLVSSTLLISVVWVMSYLLIGKRIIPRLLWIVGFVVSLFLEQSRRVNPPKWINEFLLFKALILAFFMNTFFKSRLTYLLNGLNYEKPISSFDEAVEIGMKIGSIKEYVDLFNTSDKMTRYLEVNLIHCDFDSLECANRTAFDRDMISMLSAAKTIDAKSIFFDDKAGHWLIKPLYPPMLVKPIVAAFQFGFPMFELYDKYLYRLVECGITDKISRRYFEEKALQTTEPSLASTQSLNLDHVVAPGVAWIVGAFFSILLFVLERTRLLDVVYCKKKPKNIPVIRKPNFNFC